MTADWTYLVAFGVGVLALLVIGAISWHTIAQIVRLWWIRRR